MKDAKFINEYGVDTREIMAGDRVLINNDSDTPSWDFFVATVRKVVRHRELIWLNLVEAPTYNARMVKVLYRYNRRVR